MTHPRTLAVALDFRTWRSFAVDNGLARAEAIELATALIDAAAAPGRRVAA